MAEKIKVLVVDDHAIVRSGLASILAAQPDMAIVGEAKDGQEAINKALELKPDVILMDIFMPNLSGIDAMVVIKEKMPEARVLILTVSESEENLFRALRFGARGYLLKSASIDEVIAAIRQVANGQGMLSPYAATRLIAEFRHEDEQPSLSNRELQVLRLLGEGLSNVEIGNRLYIGESTVRTYLGRLLDKLHLRNRAEAIAYAARHGIINSLDQPH